MLDFMEADRARLSDLETQILDLERSLSALRTERARVRERLNDYKYPVLTLPNEVTSEIFMCFIPAYPVAPPLIGIDSPTTLTHVCRQWRNVALATPMLWSAIEFDDDVYERTVLRCILADWIKRSRSCRLSISVYIDDDEFLKEMLGDPSTVRWEHLQLKGWVNSPFEIDSPLPMLHSLDFELYGVSTHGLIFHDAPPHLRTAVLYGRGIPAGLPWVQLTCLTLAVVPTDECVVILAQTLNLVRCVVSLDGEPELDGLTPGKVDLPFLESLVLRDNAETYQTATEEFLDLFVVPALSTLDVDEIFLREDLIARLQSLISRSGCRLQEVCIRGRLATTVGSRFRQAFPSIPTFSFPVAYEGKSDEDEYEGENDSD
ncbi:F-box domain-containing protein [Mycena sanguinolenta]|uniref:F-box domain-containing protein n=1 Tax=Mycena sanguinolenta TaxID=230812 RepID=A0A8H6ZGF2_9AGAR|nr:F-box domain-containing protein [Mycena sanguinolenta]